MNNTKKYNSLIIIDDHRMIINGIRLLIGDMFEHFHLAHDGASGIKKALLHLPQITIVDHSLPDTT